MRISFLSLKYFCYLSFYVVITYCVIFFHSEGHGKLTVFSVKAMLATMCGGKILDKLRCKYFQENQTILLNIFLSITGHICFIILSSES